ncbi:MAG: cytochrome P450 [Pseudomonadota bacterium]|nr:cytochrome P450 [Pseudomonadota bacterium]
MYVNPGLAQRPPLVAGYPWLGNAPSVVANPLLFLRNAYARYGEVFRFRVPGREHTVLAGVAANRFIAGAGKDCFSVDSVWGAVGRYMDCPHALIMVDGEIHRYQRQMLGPMLAAQSFRARIPTMLETVTEVLQQQSSGQALAVGPLFRRMLSNQLSELLLGRKADPVTVDTMIYAFNAVTKVFALRSWPRWMLQSPKVKWSEWVTRRQLQSTLSRARRYPQTSAYLSTALAALDARPDWFTEGDKLMYVLLPYVAALDTVASTHGFMLFHLLQNEVLYERIQREVDGVFGGGMSTMEDVRSMPALMGLCREVMRMEPTAFGMPRVASRDFHFRGYDIAEGDELLLFTTADHLNPRYFRQPQQFDIDRFIGLDSEHRQIAYAPFGKGAHNCLGASLAELLLPLHMGVLLYQWQVEPAVNLRKVKTVFAPAPVLSSNFKVWLRRRRP